MGKFRRDILYPKAPPTKKTQNQYESFPCKKQFSCRLSWSSRLCLSIFVGVLLLILGMGVNGIIRVSMVKGSYDTLLQEGEFSKEEKQMKKKTDPFSGAYWCFVTAIYGVIKMFFLKEE